MQFKNHINQLVRLQTSQDRDLKNGILLDRNERVDYFNNKTFKLIKKNISQFSLNATPDINLLYKELAKKHKTKTSNIYIGQGITEIISHILFSIVKSKEEVIILNQTYPMYDVLCKLHNIKYKEWKFTENFDLKFEDLKKLITKKTRVLFLVNPNLPIEFEFNEKLKKEINDICKKNNIIVAYDEAYHYFGAKSEDKNINKNKNTIVLRTFSKAWGLPGIRLGYMIANKELCNYVSKCRSLVETNAFSFQIALWALRNKYILSEHLKHVKMGSKYIRKKLKEMKEIYYGGNVTNAIIIKLKNKEVTEHLRSYLRDKKIYIRTKFKGLINNYRRISLGSPKKLSKFIHEYIKWKKKYTKYKFPY